MAIPLGEGINSNTGFDFYDIFIFLYFCFVFCFVFFQKLNGIENKTFDTILFDWNNSFVWVEIVNSTSLWKKKRKLVSKKGSISINVWIN